MANTTSDKLAYLNGTKDELKTNLIAKGMDVTSETTFRQMAEMVGQIQTGGNIEFVQININTQNQQLDIFKNISLFYFGENGEINHLNGISEIREKETINVAKNSILFVTAASYYSYNLFAYTSYKLEDGTYGKAGNCWSYSFDRYNSASAGYAFIESAGTVYIGG